jgi:type 1 glutamine amidotransferase
MYRYELPKNGGLMRRSLVRALVLLVALAPAAGITQDKKKYKLLYITQSKGFKHGSVDRKKDAPLAPSEISVTDLGKSSGLFDVECSQDISILTAEKLKDVDVVMFYTTGGKAPDKKEFSTVESWIKDKSKPAPDRSAPITPEQYGEFESWLKGKGGKKSQESFDEWLKTTNRPLLSAENWKAYEEWWKNGKGLSVTPESFAAFEEWLREGHAMIATHSATDTLGDFKPYWSLINGTFAGHPWGSGETCTMSVHEASHPVAKPWPAEFQIKDEIYQYTHHDPKSVRVIYSLNMAKCKTKMPYHVPVCWVREFGKGRLFYTNLGHNEGTWTNPQFKEHLLMGVRWALKLEDGPATPTPEVAYAEQAKAFAWVVGSEKGKNADELAAKAEKAAKADPEWGAKLYADIEKYRGMDKKKDEAKAEGERILAEIDKK